MNNIDFLIISSTIDYATDFICLEFEKRNCKFLRINRDKFADYQIVYNVSNESMRVVIGENDYLITNEDLKAVFFRAPVFYRESGRALSLEEQLYRSQWSSFIRNLIVFDNAKWINHPVNTYRAENKMLQLKTAKDVGLDIPNTTVANIVTGSIKSGKYAIKAIDTPFFHDQGDELFTYTTVISDEDFPNIELSNAPVFIQECLENKIDIRVTFIGDKLYAAMILEDGKGIEGDWRKTKKDKLQYIPIDLPVNIELKIKTYMKKLGLDFGGVDLALCDGKYYFIEVNPTGEWSWLMKSTGYDLDKSIVDWMEKRSMKKGSDYIRVIFDGIFPMMANIKTNKKVQSKIDNSEVDNIDVPNDRLLDLYQDSLKQKSSLEDKAKVDVVCVTIAFTLMLNSITFVNNYVGKKVADWVLIFALMIIVLAAGYMIIAGVLAIKVIADKNIVFEYCGKCDSAEEWSKCKEAINKNRLMNIIRNNYVFSSYQCIRNSLICFFIVFIMACITIAPSSNRIQKLNIGTNDCYEVYYASDSFINEVTNMGIAEIQDTIISFIQNNNIDQNQTFSFIDQVNKLFIKVKLKDDAIYVIDIEHYID